MGALPRELGLPLGFPSSPMSPASYLLGQRWGCTEAKHLLHQALDQVLSSCGAPPPTGTGHILMTKAVREKHGCVYGARGRVGEGGVGIPAWVEAAKGLPALVVFMLTVVMSALSLGTVRPLPHPHLSGFRPCDPRTPGASGWRAHIWKQGPQGSKVFRD